MRDLICGVMDESGSTVRAEGRNGAKSFGAGASGSICMNADSGKKIRSFSGND